MTKFICQECGDTHEASDDNDPWNCVICGGRMLPREESEVVSVGELETLIEEWRETAAMQHPEECEEFNIRCDVWEKAAGELEALLQE